jgi:protein SCO1/2
MFKVDDSKRRGKVGLTGLTLLLFVLISACSDAAPETLFGMVREPSPNVGAVVLPAVSHDNADFATKADPGRLLIAYFGYTSCPDICPSTLADLRRAVEQLGDDAEKVDVAFITVDPLRDTPERLTTYIQAFFEQSGVALRTEDASQLESAARAFGAAYERSVTDDGELEVSHSAFLYAIDEEGQILVQWPFGMTSDDMYNDLAYLFDHAI